MSGDWKFASCEGYLTWTLPALPSGGQRLFSKLSTNVVAGHTQRDDAVPSDYFEVVNIRNVAMKSATAIQIDLSNDSSSVLLVADTVDDARGWYDALQRAMRDSAQLGQQRQHQQHSSSMMSGASPPPAASPVGMSQLDRSGLDSSNPGAGATPGAFTSLSAQMREERERLEMQRRAADMREAQLRDEESRVQRQRDALAQEEQRRELDALRQQQAQQAQHAQQQQQQQQQFQRQHSNGSTASSGLPPRAPTPQRDQFAPAPQPQQQQLQQAAAPSPSPSLALNTSSQSPRPLPPDAQQQPQPPQQSFSSGVQEVGGHRYRPLSLDAQRQLEQASPGAKFGADSAAASRPLADGTGPHQGSTAYQHVRSIDEPTHQQPADSAQTTTVAHHEERPVPGLAAPRPLDGIPLSQSLRLATASGNNGSGGSRPLDLSLGVGNGGAGASQSSRPLAPEGQMRYANASGSTGMNNTPRMEGPYGQTLADAASHRVPSVSPYPASRMSQGPAPAPPGGRRGAMMVELPGTQAVNRSIAPNPSAVWREWTDPDGTIYYFHEPTGTLQRLAPGSSEYETLEGQEDDIPDAHLAHRAQHSDSATTVNLNTQTVRNLQSYGGGSDGRATVDGIRSSNVLRTEVLPPQPRGGYSPTRRAPMEALAAPRVDSQGYQGKRLHRLSLRPGDEPGRAVVTHEVQTLDAEDMSWDRNTGTIRTRDPAKLGQAGTATLHRQWEHVRKILSQGRYFKKHAMRTDNESFRFVFLTGDNSHVCCVPTSQVMLNVAKDPRTFSSATDTVQYYGPETRAMAVNSITHVCLGTEEPLVARRRALAADHTFVIVGRTHALILECNTADEAQFWCDAWNFFLEYSRPVNPKATRTPQMMAPVTYGTRTGLPF